MRRRVLAQPLLKMLPGNGEQAAEPEGLLAQVLGATEQTRQA